MKRTVFTVRFAVGFAAGLCAGVPGSGVAQAPASPPMKMGLWETTSSTKMNMPNMPSFMAGMGSKTATVHSCMTADSWAKGVAAQQQRKDCVTSNMVTTAKSYSFDLVCSKGKQTGHFEMVFDSTESGHGTSHLNIGSGGSADSVVTTKFLSSDCGSVTPDKPEIVK